MSNVIIDDKHLGDVAAAIREKNGETTQYKPSEMAAAISALAIGGGGGSINLDNCDVTMLSRIPRVSVSNQGYWWNDWQDYITDLSKVKMFVLGFGNYTAIYVKGIMADVKDGVFTCAEFYNSNSTNYFQEGYSVRFTTNGFQLCFTNANGTSALGSTSYTPALYIISDKEA